jgi:transposase-like protein
MRTPTEERWRATGAAFTTAREDVEAKRHAAKAAAVEAADAGYSQRDIAELLGVDRMTARKWVGKR